MPVCWLPDSVDMFAHSVDVIAIRRWARSSEGDLLCPEAHITGAGSNPIPLSHTPTPNQTPLGTALAGVGGVVEFDPDIIEASASFTQGGVTPLPFSVIMALLHDFGRPAEMLLLETAVHLCI